MRVYDYSLSYRGAKPIKSWCLNPEQGALDQALNLAQLPFAFKHIALMPDTHQGYGMPIGGVLATDGVVIPNAVGVDIGCGMFACQSTLAHADLSVGSLKEIMGRIRESVPVGFNHHTTAQGDIIALFPGVIGDLPVINRECHKAMFQLGTLGGGNHFIEIQKGSDGYVWFMIHSGSRNLGKKVADHYNALAKGLNAQWRSSVPLEHDLAFLPIESPEAKLYIREMKHCLNFAKENRRAMAEKIIEAFAEVTGCGFTAQYDVHHNYAAWEHHFGKNVIVHRKGATSAQLAQVGIIPGSQGTASYIVLGKGHPESFMSCSHGAGRKMGRREACRTLSLEDEMKRLDEKGIVHAIRAQSDLEEAAGAYKDIDTVMEEQKDLVDIVVKLEPMGVIKG